MFSGLVIWMLLLGWFIGWFVGCWICGDFWFDFNLLCCLRFVLYDGFVLTGGWVVGYVVMFVTSGLGGILVCLGLAFVFTFELFGLLLI